MDDSVKNCGAERGLEAESPATFHSRHITLPLPGAATDVVTGTLPGSSRRGSIAWITFSSDVDMERNYVAVVGELPGAKLPVAWVEPGEAAVPGFGADIAAGGARGREGRRPRHLDGRRVRRRDPRGARATCRAPASPAPRSTP